MEYFVFVVVYFPSSIILLQHHFPASFRCNMGSRTQ